MSGELLLLVDDEDSICQLARLYLEREGFHVETAGDGVTALGMAKELHPVVMVLDVMLPELDGFEVCKRLRASGNMIPIIMLTARDDDIDKILGLELGADDYMTKPFNPRELVARVKVQLRRLAQKDIVQAGSSEEEVIRFNKFEIHPQMREIRMAGAVVDLRAQEFEVLLILARNPGRVFTREQLLNLAWGYDFMGQTRTVDVHIAQIRKKLGKAGNCIETVTGVGYKLAA
jgi:DNA-binding response OmpR family regulator